MAIPRHAIIPSDAAGFWRAMGARAVGAAIVTAEDGEGPAGFLALSASHLSASSPIMTVAADHRTSALATIQRAEAFAINYRSPAQADLSVIFGGRTQETGSERFRNAEWERLATGAPILVGAVGAFDCELVETIDRFSMALLLGRVVAAISSGGAEPVVHFGGALRTPQAVAS